MARKHSRLTISSHSTVKRKNRPRIRVSVLVFSAVGLWFGIIAVVYRFYNGSKLVSSKENLPANLTRKEDPIVIAHVVSLIKCSRQERVTGFVDAAAVLRHSIHKNSVHSGTSKYSYRMYAIVHEQCAQHAHSLERLGYKALIKPSPVKVDDIAEGYLKGHVEMENCCGSAEFIK